MASARHYAGAVGEPGQCNGECAGPPTSCTSTLARGRNRLAAVTGLRQERRVKPPRHYVRSSLEHREGHRRPGPPSLATPLCVATRAPGRASGLGARAGRSPSSAGQGSDDCQTASPRPRSARRACAPTLSACRLPRREPTRGSNMLSNTGSASGGFFGAFEQFASDALAAPAERDFEGAELIWVDEVCRGVDVFCHGAWLRPPPILIGARRCPRQGHVNRCMLPQRWLSWHKRRLRGQMGGRTLSRAARSLVLASINHSM